MEKVNLKNKTILVYDNGLFVEFALRLADYYKEVLYYCPWKSAYPRMTEAVVGSEWENGKQLDTFDGKPFRRVLNVFDHIHEIDLAVFLDVYDGDLQVYLEEQGIPTVGSKKGENLELDRWGTKMMFKKDGMAVQPMKRFIGIDALREHLKKVDHKWVKISSYRATTETFEHVNYKLSEPVLDKLAFTLGPISKIVEFIVEDHIDAVVEQGVDTYTVNGEYPSKIICGTEVKDESYFCEVMDYEDISKGNKEVNKQMSKYYKDYNYTGFVSTEVRTTKDGINYAIDPCCRAGSPPSELYQEMFENLGEIVWGLGVDEIVEPVFKHKYGAELLIKSEWYMESHQAISFPEKYRNNIKLRNMLKIDGEYYILNLSGCSEAGAVVVTGDSPEECKQKLLEIAPTVQGHYLTISTEHIDKAIEEFEKMAKLK